LISAVSCVCPAGGQCVCGELFHVCELGSSLRLPGSDSGESLRPLCLRFRNTRGEKLAYDEPCIFSQIQALSTYNTIFLQPYNHTFFRNVQVTFAILEMQKLHSSASL